MKYTVITTTIIDYDGSGDEIRTFPNIRKARKYAKDKIKDIVPCYKNFVTVRLFKEVRI